MLLAFAMPTSMLALLLYHDHVQRRGIYTVATGEGVEPASITVTRKENKSNG